jgi:hypothetical protein
MPELRIVKVMSLRNLLARTRRDDGCDLIDAPLEDRAHQLQLFRQGPHWHLLLTDGREPGSYEIRRVDLQITAPCVDDCRVDHRGV